jgi:3-methyladenine DNA glycosylase AlkD
VPAKQTTAAAVLTELESLGSPAGIATLARVGIVTKRAWGVRMKDIQAVAKRAGRDHQLALELWNAGWYESQTIATFIAEPKKLTPEQMDTWAAGFDNWGICDTMCFHLFDVTPHAFPKIDAWATRPEEFVRRASFALLASLALHDRIAPAEAFIKRLPLIEAAATDNRNFVKKGVSWALRLIGRRNPACHVASLELAKRLASSTDPSSRWIGKDAVRDITTPAAMKRVNKGVVQK